MMTMTSFYSFLFIFISFLILVQSKKTEFTEFPHVGCLSIIKLTHVPTGFKLHSHKIAYASGSQQQSVTAYPNADDPNSLWQVQPAIQSSCKRGEPIPCGSTIRLFHVNTEKYLHSHLHVAPISSFQEVSAFGQVNKGDHWILKCKDPKTDIWKRHQPVYLIHEETSRYLSSSNEFAFGASTVAGQLEVSAENRLNANTYWKAEEGMYFKIEKTIDEDL